LLKMAANQTLDTTETASSSPGAVRMRAYRRRRRRGTRCVRVALGPPEIDRLVATGYLSTDERADREAVQAAASWFIADALAEKVDDA
jgi:hypothetical protein